MNPVELSSAFKPLIDSLQSSLVEAIKHATQKDGWDIAALFLNVLTLGGLVYSLRISLKVQETAQRQTQAAVDALEEARLQTVEARKQSDEARKENQLAVRPFLAPKKSVGDEKLNEPFHLENIGNGIALNTCIRSLEWNGTRFEFTPIPLIRKGGWEMPTVSVKPLDADELEVGDYHDLMTFTLVELLSKDGITSHELEITYDDIYQNQYQTTLSLTVVSWDGGWEFHHRGQVQIATTTDHPVQNCE